MSNAAVTSGVGVKLEDVLVHRPPMLLLDSVVSFTESSLRASVVPGPDSSFYQNSAGVPAWVGMEYMAQAIAAMAGIKAFEIGAPLPYGLLIGCSRYVAELSHFQSGQELIVDVVENYVDTEGVSVFDCVINTNVTLVKGRLTVFANPEKRFD
jgi:predicted hotdog family 3-hydroxylacyl-ACP dehydratase